MKRLVRSVISIATSSVAHHLKKALLITVSVVAAAVPAWRGAAAEGPVRAYPGVILSRGGDSLDGEQALSAQSFSALSLKADRLSPNALLILPQSVSQAEMRVAAAASDAAITCESASVRSAMRSLGSGVTCSPNHELRIVREPNDPKFSEMYAPAMMRLREAWDLTTGSDELVVQVIDTGIKANHPDLAANMFINRGEVAGNGIDDDRNGYIDDVHGINAIEGSGNPDDDHRHGTHVAGTIGAVSNNGVGVTGVAWNVRLSPCKFLSASGSGSSADAIRCLDYGVDLKRRGVNVVASSNSWGGGGFNPALLDAIRRSEAAGILFVAAAGNDNENNDMFPHYPSSYGQRSDVQGVIAVASVDSASRRSSFSNFGRNSVHLAAPGSGILSTCNGRAGCIRTPGQDPLYAIFSGTSMATPQVTGVLVLAQSVCSRPFSIAEKRRILLETVTSTAALADITVTGGIVNARAAVELARTICAGGGEPPVPPTETSAPPTVTVTPAPPTATVTPAPPTATAVPSVSPSPAPIPGKTPPPTQTPAPSPGPGKTPPPGRTIAPTRTPTATASATPTQDTPRPTATPTATAIPTRPTPGVELVCSPPIDFSAGQFTRMTGGVEANTGTLAADGTGFESVGAVVASYMLPESVTVDDRTVLRVTVSSRGPGDRHTLGFEDDDVFTHEKAFIWAALDPYDGPNYFGLPNYHGCYNETCWAVEGEPFDPPRPWGFSQRLDIPVGLFLEPGRTYDRLATANSGGHAKVESVQVCRATASLRPARRHCPTWVKYRPATREIFGLTFFPEVTGRLGLGRMHVTSIKAGTSDAPLSVEVPFTREDQFRRLFPQWETRVRDREFELFHAVVPDSIPDSELEQMTIRLEYENLCQPRGLTCIGGRWGSCISPNNLGMVPITRKIRP